MKTVSLLIIALLLISPLSAKEEISNQKPIVIVYNDGEKKIDLNDLSTVTKKVNRIIYHMLKEILLN